MTDFVHLHTHSEFSLLDGLAKIPKMVKRASETGMKALALTDHGSLYGAIDFYSAAKAGGIKPIIGCEIYVAPRSMGQREPKIDDKNYHLTLLAQNETGYRNLLKIVSRANLEGFYYKPRADKELIAKHSEGLICLSGCLSGELSRLLLDGQEEKAREVAAWHRDVFGKDNYFIEIQNQFLRDQERLNPRVVALARELDIPLVAANDSHYVMPEDHRAHDVLLCIQTNSTESQANRMKLETAEFYLRTPEQMARAFPELPDALQNTMRVAEMVDLNLDFSRVQLPHFDLPEGETPETYLRKECETGLVRRYGTIDDEKRERLEYELSVIEKTGYPLYFLIVADYVRHARDRGILALPRGSVAGSICIYALGICDVDPLQFNLMFERFLHAERIGMPDIDMDFADDRRGEVIEYVRQKYGHDRVAQIITFGTMAARAAVRDVGRALGMTYGEVDRVAKAIPMGMGLAEARKTADLKALADEDPRVQDLLGLAESMEGIARNASTHAAGLVISRDPLDEYVPLQRNTKGEEGAITQWDFTVIEKVGLLKMDLLGLANLTILDKARRIIEERRPDTKIDLQHLPMDYDDPSGQPKKTFDMLANGDTTAVFQLESGGMRKCLKGLRPNQITDLLAIVALYRPGPMDYIPAFQAAKNGQTQVTYLHEDLKPILEETYGVCVYQDQVLQIVRKIAGFSWGEADVLRKAMGKKNVALMEEQKEKFLTRSTERGYDRSLAEQLWAVLEPFAGYGFPKGHAAAYAVVSYQTAFLKANYPAEYMSAVLSSEAGNPAKVAEAVAECRRLSVEVLPPDVNTSGLGFTLETLDGADAIRFGLSGIKNVGHGAIEMLVKVREEGAFKDLADFCRRVDLRQLNKRAMESLVKAGAMDSFGERAALLAGLDTAMAQAQQDQRARQAGQTNLFDLFGEAEAVAAPAFKLPEVAPVDRRQRLVWEKEMMGLYISEHPLAAVARSLAMRVSMPISELAEEMVGQTVTIGGFISSMRLIPTKKGDLMAAVELEDLGGSTEVVVFPRTLQQQREVLKEDAIVIVRGKVDARDDRPKLLAETVELLEASDDELEPEPEGTQTAYPMDAVEDDAATFGESARVIAEARAAAIRADAEVSRRAQNGDASSASWPSPPPAVHAPAPAAPAPSPFSAEPVNSDRAPEPTMDDLTLAAPPAAGLDDVPGGQSLAGTTSLVLELLMERTALPDRDVNRLLRLSQLLEHHPGGDQVVLRLSTNGREDAVLHLRDGVRCTTQLIEEATSEFGEGAVRVRRRVWAAVAAEAPMPARPTAADGAATEGSPAWPGANVPLAS